MNSYIEKYRVTFNKIEMFKSFYIFIPRVPCALSLLLLRERRDPQRARSSQAEREHLCFYAKTSYYM